MGKQLACFAITTGNGVRGLDLAYLSINTEFKNTFIIYYRVVMSHFDMIPFILATVNNSDSQLDLHETLLFCHHLSQHCEP